MMYWSIMMIDCQYCGSELSGKSSEPFQSVCGSRVEWFKYVKCYCDYSGSRFPKLVISVSDEFQLSTRAKIQLNTSRTLSPYPFFFNTIAELYVLCMLHRSID